VVGITNKAAATPQSWNGWKFLVTAKHVLAKQQTVQIRMNAADESKAVCQKIDLMLDGPKQNVIFADDGVDLVAVTLPIIQNTDPTVVTSPLLIDEQHERVEYRSWDRGTYRRLSFWF
jgi:hypothetical protein